MHPSRACRPAAEKDRFYDQLHAVAAKVPLSEVCNPEGERILDFGVAHNMVVGNTLF